MQFTITFATLAALLQAAAAAPAVVSSAPVSSDVISFPGATTITSSFASSAPSSVALSEGSGITSSVVLTEPSGVVSSSFASISSVVLPFTTDSAGVVTSAVISSAFSSPTEVGNASITSKAPVHSPHPDGHHGGNRDRVTVTVTQSVCPQDAPSTVASPISITTTDAPVTSDPVGSFPSSAVSQTVTGGTGSITSVAIPSSSVAVSSASGSVGIATSVLSASGASSSVLSSSVIASSDPAPSTVVASSVVSSSIPSASA